MGSYLSAPMLVFRLGVLPRTCETSCGDGPAGASHGSLGALLFLPPLPRRPAPGRTVFFISSYFAVALVSCPALPLYPDTSLVTFHIQSPLAYLGAPGTRCAALTGRLGEGKRADEGIMRIWKRECGKISRKYSRDGFDDSCEKPDAIRSWQRERTRSAKRSSSSSLRLGSA